MALPAQETAAIILDCRDHGESDKILTFFCLDAGRLSGIAKGAKRSKKRFVNKLELFSLLHLSYIPPRQGGLALIQAAELESSFLNLRKNIDLYYAANIIREYVLMGISEGERDTEVFNLLHWALHSLDCRRSGLSVVVIFLLRFFDYIGYKPDLLHCHHCGAAVSTAPTQSFNYMTGGLVCRNCTIHGSQTTLSVALGTIRLLSDVQALPLARLHRLQFSTQTLDESLVLLHRYGRKLFQRDIHSWGTVIARRGGS